MKTSVNDVFKGNNSVNGLTFVKLKSVTQPIYPIHILQIVKHCQQLLI